MHRKHRHDKRYRTLFTLGLMLMAVAVASTAVLSGTVLQSVLSLVSANSSIVGSIDRLETMVAVSGLAALVVVLISLAIVHREQRRIHILQDRFSQMLHTADLASDLVTIMNRRGKIEYVNRAVEIATGFSRQELLGKRRDPWLPWHADRRTFEEMRRMTLAGHSFEGTLVCRRKDGSTFLAEEHVAPLRSPNGSVIRLVSTARDITRMKQVEDRLGYLDRYDPLTGIPNRRHFAKLLVEELGEKRPADRLLSVIILDIDRFKYINDLFGPDVGDEVLRSITAILRSVAGDQDTIARLGSDEFGVIHHYAATLIDTGALAERIRTAVSRKLSVGGQDVVVTVTLGIASFPDNGKDARSLLRNADMALSRAKAQGRNTIQFFSREMSDRIQSFYIMEKRLMGALRKSEYRVNYQPYWDLTTRRVTGAEALIRWHNNDLGVISPATFIPALEESGLIVDVGEWVMRTACRQIKDWKRTKRPVSISVNLSLAQIRHRHLVSMVTESIRDSNIDPSHLTLELTESICIQDIDFAVTILKKLKDVGVSLSIDDFGTGYSSLSYIKRLPVDTLKIDQSFIRDVARDPDAASIITAITGMARSLRLKTIAEGVESEEQRNILHLLRCDMGQGYFFSPAIGADEFERMLI
jgi:diguanylate cyclase (GGDEF)-like protein/PAS domain S-box-containing protein